MYGLLVEFVIDQSTQQRRREYQQWQKKEVRQEYIDSITQYKKADGYYVPGEFVVAVGYKKKGTTSGALKNIIQPIVTAQ